MQAGNAVGKSYTSSFDGLRKIVAAEGPQGLYKGIGPKLTQSSRPCVSACPPDSRELGARSNARGRAERKPGSTLLI